MVGACIAIGIFALAYLALIIDTIGDLPTMRNSWKALKGWWRDNDRRAAKHDKQYIRQAESDWDLWETEVTGK